MAIKACSHAAVVDGAGEISQSALVRQMAELADSISPNEFDSPSAAQDIAACLDLLARCWPQSPLDRNTASSVSSGFANRGVAQTSSMTGQRVGRYQIKQLIGHGGFGVVFLAHDERLNLDVALKVPRPEMLVSMGMRQRFMREAQATAVLDHPGVVPIYETGEIGPICYIASRYVAGPTLAEWLRNRPAAFSALAAARLVATLADAVQHAHSRGILHRDLKPSNVLLEPTGNTDAEFPFTARLSDFGLAKRLEAEEQFTLDGALIGTPRYMAPEQAAGKYKEIGIQTDVYGLGVMLFELLAAEPPFIGESDAETMRRIQEEEPSTGLLRRKRVPLDLQTICIKCLQKDQANRYESAAALATDLRRFLAGEPVLARPIGALARVARWSRRHPLSATACLALVTVTGAGIAGVTWQWTRAERNLKVARYEAHRAEENLKQIERVVIDLDWVVQESDAWSSGDSNFQNILRTKAERYGEIIFSQHPDQAAVPAPILAAYESLAAMSLSLDNKVTEANERYRKSMKLWCDLLREEPNNEEYLRAFQTTLFGYGLHLLQSGVASDEIWDFHAAQEMLAGLNFNGVDDVRARRAYAQVTSDIGYANIRNAKHKIALAAFELSSRLWHDLGERYPAENYRAGEGGALRAAAKEQFRTFGDPLPALAICRESQQLFEQLVQSNPSDQRAQRELGVTIADTAHFAKLAQRPDEATELFKASIAAFEKAAEGEPSDHVHLSTYAETIRKLAQHLLDTQGVVAALPAFQKCAAVLETLLSGNHLPANQQNQLAFVYYRIASGQEIQGQVENAIQAFRRSIELFHSTDSLQFVIPDSRSTLANCHAHLGDLYQQSGNFELAATAYSTALESFNSLLQKKPNDAVVQWRLERTRKSFNKLQQAQALQASEGSD
jgi:tetratricopeptide (TPR) repeat protein